MVFHLLFPSTRIPANSAGVFLPIPPCFFEKSSSCMGKTYIFECEFCGENFGNDPIKLALHIRDNHEHNWWKPKRLYKKLGKLYNTLQNDYLKNPARNMKEWFYSKGLKINNLLWYFFLVNSLHHTTTTRTLLFCMNQAAFYTAKLYWLFLTYSSDLFF